MPTARRVPIGNDDEQTRRGRSTRWRNSNELARSMRSASSMTRRTGPATVSRPQDPLDRLVERQALVLDAARSARSCDELSAPSTSSVTSRARVRAHPRGTPRPRRCCAGRLRQGRYGAPATSHRPTSTVRPSSANRWASPATTRVLPMPASPETRSRRRPPDPPPATPPRRAPPLPCARRGASVSRRRGRRQRAETSAADRRGRRRPRRGSRPAAPGPAEGPPGPGPAARDPDPTPARRRASPALRCTPRGRPPADRTGTAPPSAGRRTAPGTGAQPPAPAARRRPRRAGRRPAWPWRASPGRPGGAPASRASSTPAASTSSRSPYGFPRHNPRASRISPTARSG